MRKGFRYLLLSDDKLILYSHEPAEIYIPDIEPNAVINFKTYEELINSDITFTNYCFCNLKDGSSLNGLPCEVTVMYLDGNFYESKYCEDYNKFVEFKRDYLINGLELGQL